jgi:hypothetical protein
MNEVRYGDTSVVYFGGYFPLTIGELESNTYRANKEPVSSLGPTWYGKYRKSTPKLPPPSQPLIKKEVQPIDYNENCGNMIIEPVYTFNPIQTNDSPLNEIDSEEEAMLMNVSPASIMVDVKKMTSMTTTVTPKLEVEIPMAKTSPSLGVMDIMQKVKKDEYVEEVPTIKTSSLLRTIEKTAAKAKTMTEFNKEKDDEGDERKVLDSLSRSSKEYMIFRYLDHLERGESPMVLSFGKVYNTFYDKCQILITANELDKPQVIKRMIMNFVERVILELISRDEKGKDILDIMNRFHKLFISDTCNGIGKNDYRRLDHIHQLIDKTCKKSFDIKNDNIYLAYSQKKTRGRRKQSNKLPACNEVDLIRKTYIEPATVDMIESEGDEEEENEEDMASTTTVAVADEEKKKYYPPLDNYKVFLKTMKHVNNHLPRSSNNGYYLENVHRMMRNYKVKKEDEAKKEEEAVVEPKWPLWRVFKAMFNMQCMPDIISRVNFQTNGHVYHCCYSNELIKDGDDVYIIQIYENDINRFEEWQINKIKPDNEYNDDALLHSNKVFIMKKKRLSPVSLFPVEYTETYKSLHRKAFDDFEGKNTKSMPTTIIATTTATTTTTTTITATVESPLIRLNVTQDNVSVIERWDDLFSISDDYMARNESVFINRVRKVLDGIHRPTLITSRLYKIVCNELKGYSEAEYDEKLIAIINFIESFFIIQINDEDCVLNENDFVTLINKSIFNGKESVTLRYSPNGSVILKNCLFTRHFLYLIYNRRVLNGKNVTDWSEVNPFLLNLNTQSKMMMKQVDLPYYQEDLSLLIAFFDYLFKKSV